MVREDSATPVNKTESGCFEIHERDLAGRIGLLKTKTTTIETPALFPVVNHVKKLVPTRTISRIGYKQIIANAYLISKHSKRAATSKGIHKLLGFNGAIMTDSGAYQVLSHGHVEVEPAEIIRFQEAIGTDIGVILDIPTPSNASYNRAEESVEITIKRAKESIKQRKRRDILWSGPIQGGTHPDLVQRSAKAMSKLPFDIYAIGSPTTIMEQYQYANLVDLIMTAKHHLPIQAPVHLFGAGHPAMFSLAVAMGCDLFDSAAYALYARDGRYLTVDGTLHLEDLGDLPCECPICVNTTPKDLLGIGEAERERSLAVHNLYVSMREIKQIKQAIRRGTLWELLRMRCASHPRLWEGFMRLTEYAQELEESDPMPTPYQAGLTFVGPQDLSRPEVMRHRTRLLENYSPPKGRSILLLIPETDLRRVGLPRGIEETLEGFEMSRVHVCMFSTAFGIVPIELAETFPLSQYILTGIGNEGAANKVGDSVLEFISKHKRHYKQVILLDRPDQDLELHRQLLRRLEKEEIPTKILQLASVDENIRESGVRREPTQDLRR